MPVEGRPQNSTLASSKPFPDTNPGQSQSMMGNSESVMTRSAPHNYIDAPDVSIYAVHVINDVITAAAWFRD